MAIVHAGPRPPPCMACGKPSSHVILSLWAKDSFACSICAPAIAPPEGKGVVAVPIWEVGA